MTDLLNLTQGQGWLGKLGYLPTQNPNGFLQAAQFLRDLPLRELSKTLHEVSEDELRSALSTLSQSRKTAPDSLTRALILDSIDYLRNFEKRLSLFDQQAVEFYAKTSNHKGSLADFIHWLHPSVDPPSDDMIETLQLILPKRGQILFKGKELNHWDWPETKFSWFSAYLSFVIDGFGLRKDYHF
jgi:hypothetical protein